MSHNGCGDSFNRRDFYGPPPGAPNVFQYDGYQIPVAPVVRPSRSDGLEALERYLYTMELLKRLANQ